MVQLRELISQQPTQNTTRHQDSCIISTELTKLRQDRDSYRRELTTLSTEVRELQQDRENHMVLLTADIHHKNPKQTSMLFGSKQTVHAGRVPDHHD